MSEKTVSTDIAQFHKNRFNIQMQRTNQKNNPVRGNNSNSPIVSILPTVTSDVNATTPVRDYANSMIPDSTAKAIDAFMKNMMSCMNDMKREMKDELRTQIQTVETTQVNMKLAVERQQENLQECLAAIVDENAANALKVARRFSEIEQHVVSALTPGHDFLNSIVEQEVEGVNLTPVPAQPELITTPTNRRGSTTPYVANVSSAKKSNPILYSRASTIFEEKEKLQKCTIKAYMLFKERYDALKSQNPDDRALTLASVISSAVIRELINNERILQTDISRMPGFNQNIFYELSDELVIGMFANKFKPFSLQDWGEQFYSALKGTLKSGQQGWVFGIPGYHRHLYPQMNELIFRIEETYKMLSKSRRVGEDYLYPKLTYGKKESPGLFRYFLHCMDAYEKPFIQTLPEQEESLKALKTEEEFFILVKTANDKMARMGREFEIQEQRLAVPATLQEVFPHYSIGGVAQGPSRRCDSRRDFSATLKLFDENEASSVQEDEDNNPPPLVYDSQDEQEDDVELFFGNANQSAFSKSRIPGGDPYPKNKARDPQIFYDKPAERQLPCYSYAYDRKCTAGAACVYSHEENACRNYIERQLKRLSDSPFVSSKMKAAIISASPPSASTQIKSILRAPTPAANGRALMLSPEDDSKEDNSSALSQVKMFPDA